MSIDWITVAAQIVNFLVLVWLLKRFLYRPILDGIDAREREIADRMAEATAAKDRAQAAEQAYREKARSLTAAQSEMEEAIRKAAQEQGDAILAQSRAQQEQEEAALSAQLQQQAKTYTAKLHEAGAQSLLALTRKALTDLADDEFEGRMARHFIQKLKPMVPDLSDVAGKSAEAVVASHAALSAATQKKLATALAKMFPETTLRFETDEAQAPGLVLRMGGAQVEWTLASYIDGLDAMMADRLGAGAGA